MIRLRWLAAAGLAVAPWPARLVGAPLSPWTFLALGVVVASYNALINLWVRRTGAVAEAGVHAQIGADLAALAVVFHFSGGIENPLLPFFAFHVMIAAIVLSRAASFTYASVAAGLVGALALAERAGALAHQPFLDLAGSNLYQRGPFVAAVVSAETALLFIVAYLTSDIGDLLRRREAALVRSNQALADEDRLKSQYMLRLAHSLLHRLEDVERATSSALRDLSAGASESARGMLGRAQQWLASLHRYVQDVVDLSRIRAAGTPVLSYVYLPRIVYQQVQDLQALAAERNIRIRAEVDDDTSPIMGDPQALGQALENVLRNAIVYGTPDSTVRVGLHAQDNALDLTVENDGMGIAAGDLPHVFEEFYRGEKAREVDPRGSGLGLSIARHVMEQHGGSISVASEEGKGCRFVLSVPLVVGQPGTEEGGVRGTEVQQLIAP